MEEGVQRLRRVSPLLNVIDNQHIDGLIEVDEVVGGVLAHGVSELHLEETRTDIEHTLLRIGLLATHTDGIDEVSLTTARGSEDEEGVEGRFTRMLCNGESHRTGEFVGITLDKGLESLLGIKLRI